jgi:hypothetical protein
MRKIELLISDEWVRNALVCVILLIFFLFALPFWYARFTNYIAVSEAKSRVETLQILGECK